MNAQMKRQMKKLAHVKELLLDAQQTYAIYQTETALGLVRSLQRMHDMMLSDLRHVQAAVTKKRVPYLSIVYSGDETIDQLLGIPS